MRIKNVLKQSGLTEKQAKVYLACLELGSSTVYMIARQADIPRATCYDVLESLSTQGLVSRFTKNKKRYYTAEDPKKIVGLAEQRAKNLKSALPQLEAFFYTGSKEKPRVKLFEGKEGMWQIFREILEDKKDLLAFSSVDDLLNSFGEDWARFVQERVKRKIISRVILRDTPKAHERKAVGKEHLRLVKLVPKELAHKGTIIVFGNKVALFSFAKENMAVVIENKQIATTERAALEYLWEKAG